MLYSIGFASGNGPGVEQDYKEAMKWYLKVRGKGDTNAQCNANVVYKSGRGVT